MSKRILISAILILSLVVVLSRICGNHDHGSSDIQAINSSINSISSSDTTVPPSNVSEQQVKASGSSQNIVKDRYLGISPIAERMHEPIAGLQLRERLVFTGGKYSIIRVLDTFTVNPSTRELTLANQVGMVGDHVVARLEEGCSQKDLLDFAKQHGLSIRTKMKSPNHYLVSIEPVTLDSVSTLTNILSNSECVDVVEPDYLVHLAETTPNDPSFSVQWGMTKIEMPKVWDMTVGSSEAVVAVFDTGTDLLHEDIVSNLWINPVDIAGNDIDEDGNGYTNDVYGWDFYKGTGAANGADNDPSDIHGHGSHVAGIIGAVGNNGLGVAGVNWNIKIMTIKFFGYNTSGGIEGFASDAMDGVYYVISHKMRGIPVRVTSHSWGGEDGNTLLRDALDIAGGQGIMHTIAAGNDGYLNNDIFPQYPANFALDNIISVANTSSSDGLYSSSHYGATTVDIGAPGVSIHSIKKGGGYTPMWGTSMSTPHVAGVAALMFGYMPHLTWPEVRLAMFEGVTPLASLNGKCLTGGRLNAYKAFERVDPHIEYEPLGNTAIVDVDHVIDAQIKPSLPFIDTNKVVVLWNLTGDTDSFSTNIMQHISEDHFRGIIPGQPLGSKIYYMISATTKTGRTTTDPENSPTALHNFDVTIPVNISVYGTPKNYGTVDPEYGSENTAPWGSTVTASASLSSTPTNGHRYRCSGWYGGGSVPRTGATNSFSFVIKNIGTQPNTILWNWDEQYLLTQTSFSTNAVNKLSWLNKNVSTSTVTAPGIVETGGTTYAFVCWNIDGVRYPSATNTAENPATGLIMNMARDAYAVYLPEDEDTDLDDLPDWWEMYNFANLNYGDNDDPDLDGFLNASELADSTDPRDPGSVPTGPTIDHLALEDPMASLSPWKITATVTDSTGVESVELAWQRNSQLWNNVTMTLTSADTYTAEIPSPHVLGDSYTYYIQASDVVMNTSTSAWHTFSVAYPLADVIPGNLSIELEQKSTTTIPITLTNSGNATLTWQLQTNRNYSISDNTNGWDHSGDNDFWHISQQKAHSEPYAWHCGNDYLGSYENLTDARLITPAVMLGGNPSFSFWQWVQFERDSRIGHEGYYWDGAVIDITTNNGVSFSRIDPIGGYPYKITDNVDSPFPGDTPCLGGTGGWERIEFDLSAYESQSVQIAFRFGSDRFSVDLGWFVDDIQFDWDVTWASLSLTSGVVAAETSAEVPISINSFGLPIGQHKNVLSLACNDPTQPTLCIPIILYVAKAGDEANIYMDTENPNEFIISWQADESHTYSLKTTTDLSNNPWVSIAGYINLPGINGTMSYTGTVDGASSKFYRIEESP